MTVQRYERIPQWTQGDRLRKARESLGLGQREFSELIGVSHQTVTNAEKGHRTVRKITLNAWSMATGVPVEWLEVGTEGPQGPQPAPTGSTDALADLTRTKAARAARHAGPATRGYLVAA